DAASAASLLVNLADPSLPLPTTALFSAGQTIELEGAQRGGRALPVATLDITATTTVQDLLTFFDTAMGIHSLTSTNPDGASPGSTIDPATGVISIVSNTGEAADLTIDAANLRLLNADGSLSRLPFVPTDSADASGESGRTTMVAYDSLGNVVTFDVSFTLVSKNGGNGTTWRYDIESSNNAGGNLFVQSGTLQFDTQGRIVDPAPVPVSIGRTGTGSVDPLVFNLRFTGAQGELTALVDTPSEFSSIARNGLPAGTLERWSIGADGVVAGSFSNGAVRTLGRVVLASFTNYEGLVDLGGGLFRPGGNSGEAAIVTPGSAGTGGILSGSLELSNVDLGQEFIDLILTSTGYTASSRVIQTTDELIQQLLLIGR
ncbi:MAG: hypothetical protein CMJ31_04200, partial [Phycisphaerae bacterium]|nr:hypothetical protein [Phycisphaerae bacterium]